MVRSLINLFSGEETMIILIAPCMLKLASLVVLFIDLPAFEILFSARPAAVDSAYSLHYPNLRSLFLVWSHLLLLLGLLRCHSELL